MATVTELLADLASGVLLSTARVTSVSRLSRRFVEVELRADVFRTTFWAPGAKLRIRPRRGTLALRTYTPVAWNRERGVARLIAFTHGEGPAADWFGRVSPGDDCEVLGPRRSIDLSGLAGPVLFVGDESSVGLACALHAMTADVQHVFEAGEPDELTAVLEGLGHADTAVVVPKRGDRAALLREAADIAESGGPFDLVLSGDAATVHAVRRDARHWSRPPVSTRARAYWAAGRTGFD